MLWLKDTVGYVHFRNCLSSWWFIISIVWMAYKILNKVVRTKRVAYYFKMKYFMSFSQILWARKMSTFDWYLHFLCYWLPIWQNVSQVSCAQNISQSGGGEKSSRATVVINIGNSTDGILIKNFMQLKNSYLFIHYLVLKRKNLHIVLVTSSAYLSNLFCSVLIIDILSKVLSFQVFM